MRAQVINNRIDTIEIRRQPLVENRATSPERFRDENAAGGWTQEQLLLDIRSSRFVNDITALRRRPFLKLDDDRFLALDLPLVLELITTGLFVLVCADKAMECLGMNRYLNQLFQEFFVLRPHPIRPLTIISIDELEQVLPYTAGGHISWQELFNSRFQRDEVSISSVHQKFYEIQRDRGLQPLRNEYLQRRFDEMWSRIWKN